MGRAVGAACAGGPRHSPGCSPLTQAGLSCGLMGGVGPVCHGTSYIHICACPRACSRVYIYIYMYISPRLLGRAGGRFRRSRNLVAPSPLVSLGSVSVCAVPWSRDPLPGCCNAFFKRGGVWPALLKAWHTRHSICVAVRGRRAFLWVSCQVQASGLRPALGREDGARQQRPHPLLCTFCKLPSVEHCTVCDSWCHLCTSEGKADVDWLSAHASESTSQAGRVDDGKATVASQVSPGSGDWVLLCCGRSQMGWHSHVNLEECPPSPIPGRGPG